MSLLRRLRLAAATMLAGALAGSPCAQAATPLLPTAASLWERYQRLDAGQRSDLVRRLERHCVRADLGPLQQIQAMQQGAAAYPAATAIPYYDPRQLAPAAAPRQLVGPDAAAHRSATTGMAPFVCLPDLRRQVDYDWLGGKAVRRAGELGDDDRFANLVHGLPPGSDHAVARVLAALDTEPTQRRLGDYFAHLYADRFGHAFAGITLFDAWHSGAVVEMPDTEVIAFARFVQRTTPPTAPIPANARRERLYRAMADGYQQHRDHRVLRLALAATFVAAEPGFAPEYANLLPRAHWLWQHVGRDPKALPQWLQRVGDRHAVLAHIDAAMSQDPAPGRHQAELRAMAAWLRELADRELAASGV